MAPGALTGSRRPGNSSATCAAIEKAEIGDFAEHALPGSTVSLSHALDVSRHGAGDVRLALCVYDQRSNRESFRRSQHGSLAPFLVPEEVEADLVRLVVFPAY